MVTRIRLAHALAALGCALALTAAGCGGDDDDNGGSAGGTTAAETTEATTPATTETEAETTETEAEDEGGATASAQGEEIFGANCSSCHTLAAAGASGSVGPNLDDSKPNEARVEQMVKNGGGAMPSFEGQLSDEEIAAVAAYVSENAGK